MRSTIDVDVAGKRKSGCPNLRWKDACKIDMTGGAERGQHNEQGIMEEENKLQMIGQVWDKQDGDISFPDPR